MLYPRRMALLVLLVSCLAGTGSSLAGDPVLSVPRGTPSRLSISFVPQAEFPLLEASSYFSSFGGAGLTVEYSFASVPWIFVWDRLSYSYVPLAVGPSLSLIGEAVGGGVWVGPTPWLTLRLTVGGGGYLSLFNDPAETAVGGNPLLEGGVSASFRLSPAVSVGLGATYRHCFGLWSGLTAQLVTTLNLGGDGNRPPGLAGSRVPRRVTPSGSIPQSCRTCSLSSTNTTMITPWAGCRSPTSASSQWLT